MFLIYYICYVIALLVHKKAYSYIMRQCPKEHKYMPYHMEILEALFCIDYGTNRVQYTSGKDHPEEKGVGIPDEQGHEHYKCPSHYQIYQ